jgi:hypothetical protein
LNLLRAFPPFRGELENVDATLRRIRYLRLRKELLEGANPEINTDKQLLVSRMEELGFRRAIVTLSKLWIERCRRLARRSTSRGAWIP